MTHAILMMATTAVAIIIFMGLAIYMITGQPRGSINWVFSLLCLTIATIYLSSFFLVAQPETSLAPPSFALRWKWAAIALSSTLYLHLLYFYFPASWRRYRFWVLIPSYFISGSLALTALYTYWLIAGFRYQLAPHIISPLSGPLMPFHAAFFLLQIIWGASGLLTSYRIVSSPSLRYQIISLLVPTGLIFIGGVVHWALILARRPDSVPHELPDALLILAAVFGARTVVRYGSFTGRPLAWRSIFYASLAAGGGLAALYGTLNLDHWLIHHNHLPYPPATGLLVLVVVAGFPAFSQRVMSWLDPRLFPREGEQRAIIQHLVQTLVETPDPHQFQTDLLTALCITLRVPKGYLALATPDLPSGCLRVQATYGNLEIQPGDTVRRPLFPRVEPQLISALLLASNPPEQGWQEINLFCPLSGAAGLDGLIALGEKQKGEPFTPEEIDLCAELVRQLDQVGSMVRLREYHHRYLEATRLQGQTLQQLEKEVTFSPPALPTWGTRTVSLEIRVLGPLQVVRQGEPLPESAWGSEKAKALLAYLLWKSPLGVGREELSQMLWPDRSTDEAANVFHVTLHRLRRALQPEREGGKGEGYIQHERGWYRFNTQAPHWLDVKAFQELVTRAEPASLKAAVELYRGAYFEDLAWAFPPEIEAERRRLEQLHGDALRRLAGQANNREASLYLEKLLAIEPGDEMVHQALVLNYLARGRPDLARHQVIRWQQALTDLDVDPSPEALDLWRMVEVKGKGQTG